jgi:hypothetical protein
VHTSAGFLLFHHYSLLTRALAHPKLFPSSPWWRTSGNFSEMTTKQQKEPPALSGFATIGDWLDHGHAGPFFPTRSSVEWFIRQHRRELVKAGALIPREGRSGSLVNVERMPKVVLSIFKRKARRLA